MKEVAMTYGFFEVTIPARETIFIRSNHNINRRLPKYFKIEELFESSIKAMKEAIVYRIPTYVSEIILVKKTELT